jgi:hypothetical protein
MHADLLQSDYLQVDETPIHCNDPDHPGKTSTGWLWALSRPGGDVVFCWRLTRKHEELPPLLKNYKGLLHSDGYQAYPQFAAANKGVVWLSCWAHTRRKFTDALRYTPGRAGFVLGLIAQLYHWEKQWDRRLSPAASPAARYRSLKPTLRPWRDAVMPPAGQFQALVRL